MRDGRRVRVPDVGSERCLVVAYLLDAAYDDTDAETCKALQAAARAIARGEHVVLEGAPRRMPGHLIPSPAPAPPADVVVFAVGDDVVIRANRGRVFAVEPNANGKSWRVGVTLAGDGQKFFCAEQLERVHP